MRYRNVALVLVASVALSCSSDSITGPGHRDPNVPFTIELTSVSGARVPAVYFADTAGNYRSWADSATVTIQPDGVIVFRMYESSTYPFSEGHEDQESYFFSASGRLTSDSTFQINYTNTSPDHGTISHDGSVTLDLFGVDDDGSRLPFGKWLFATPYHGPAFNVAPHVDSIVPASVLVHSTDATLLIDGLSFVPSSRASWGGRDLNASYISEHQLRVSIPADLLNTVGVFEILVTNPEPGGGTYYYPFAVTRPAPTIVSISPSTIVAGATLTGIRVTGTGFDASTLAVLNGTLRQPVGEITETSFFVALDPIDIAGPGVIQVAVGNPPPGGGVSASIPFTVTSR